MKTFWVACDQTVFFDQVRKRDGTFLNEGTGTWALYDQLTGDIVLSGNLTYVPDSDGQYTSPLDADDAAVLVDEQIYVLVLIWIQGGLKDTRKDYAVAKNKP